MIDYNFSNSIQYIIFRCILQVFQPKKSQEQMFLLL